MQVTSLSADVLRCDMKRWQPLLTLTRQESRKIINVEQPRKKAGGWPLLRYSKSGEPRFHRP